jgi:hypothetical protein
LGTSTFFYNFEKLIKSIFKLFKINGSLELEQEIPTQILKMELEEHMMEEEMRHGCLFFNSTKEPFDQMQLKILFSHIARHELSYDRSCCC